MNATADTQSGIAFTDEMFDTITDRELAKKDTLVELVKLHFQELELRLQRLPKPERDAITILLFEQMYATLFRCDLYAALRHHRKSGNGHLNCYQAEMRERLSALISFGATDRISPLLMGKQFFRTSKRAHSVSAF